MQVFINAQDKSYNDHTPELKATRKKFAGWDLFTLSGTDHKGHEFRVEFHLDTPDEAFEMVWTEFAYDHPDNPKNILKEDRPAPPPGAAVVARVFLLTGHRPALGPVTSWRGSFLRHCQ